MTKEYHPKNPIVTDTYSLAISHAELSCHSLHSLSIYSTCQGRSIRWRLIV